MDSRLLLLSQLLFVLFYGTSSQSYLNEARQRLNAFKQSYNNSQSDIIIFLDVSGSVSDYGFHTEKYFVSSLLNEFSVAVYSTRVAIITFGHRVRTNINFINLQNKKTQDTTKCEFKKLFEYQVKHRKGYATYMGTALNQGHELLKEAERQGWKRKNVNTVTFMITDGRWNGGLDPVAKARELRNSNFHLDMFSIGVDRASHQQLKAIASAPNKVIYANSFTSFKQLAKYIRGDAHERVYYEVSKDKCATACHSQAKCTCGTVAGKYVCACIAGYSGNGINCTPCPLGSYKDYPSPEKCKACPDNSNTKSIGSRFIDDCHCKAGYEGNPKKKIECTPVKCPPIAAPHNGKMTGAKCNGIYRAKCFFECNTGYLRDGPPFRECLANKQWSGKLVECDVLKCNDIPPFHHGSAVCSGTKYQDKCTFTCDRGYEIIGSSQKTCQANGQWTGTDVVRCQAKKCPVLPKLSFGSVEPVDCVTRSQHFGAGCIFQCSRGYSMQGNKNLRCKEDGTWTYSVPTCIDTEPPQIVCPNKIETKTDDGKPAATIDFNLPEFGDNSQLFGSAEVKLQQSPEEIKSPYAFPVGTTRIHYTVTDKKGNINRCSFTVKVEDKEPPRTISCPKSKLVPVGVEQNQIPVSWAPVIFTDNCGSEKLTIHQSAKNNSIFGRGSHVIDYTAYDKAGNVAKCQFIIRVAAKPCKYYPPPINGGAIEKSVLGGELVIPACSKGFEFATQPAKFYQCFGNGDWFVWPYDKSMPWPDCTVLYNAQAVKGFEFQYFSGDCADPAVQLEAKKSFLTAFQEFLVQVYPDYCDVDKSCTVDNVHVECGERKAIGNRRRRGTPKKTIFIDLDLKIENKKRTSPQSITRDLNNLASNVKASSKLKKLTISNQILTYEGIEVNPVKITCQNGSVYGMNQDFSFACQSCPAGTHYNLGKKSCQDCAEDTYQEEYGRFHCNKCPIGTFTGGTKTKNSTECRAKCPGGEFSDNGLENCSPCPIGSYQHVVGSKRCNKCPGATTTTSEGAKSFSECAVVCAAGSFSETGVEPCELCPVGQYQTSSQNKKCTPCPVGETTQGKGATSSSECQVLDPCNLSPCNNGGACQFTKNIYKCVCKPGYQGRNCETEINECESNPCYEGASCLDKVNNYVCVCPPGQTGKHCDRKVGSFCSSNPCVNGACIEEPSDFICNCQAGYTGKFCESQINECASGPCENGGKCSDLHPGYDCQCNVGYTGVRCQINQDGCSSDPCLNEAKCLSLGKDFQCNCQAGYGGKRCEVDVNDCVSGPCKNNGKCIDKVNGYECECDRNFGGKNCEIEQPTDYDLHFKESVGVGSSVVNLKKDILAFTIAFWMKAADPENTDPGTPLSYAVEYGGKVYDNALVIHDYTGFDIFINNEKHTTEVDADDGKWHHVAVSWKSSTGKLVLYKDGSLVSQTIIQKNKVIPGGGVMILGQEQDIVGGNFTASEAFYGHISQVNMWDKVLSDADIHKLASYCAFQYIGNLVAWGDFLSGLEGGEKIQPSQACKENKCWSNWINRDNPQSGGGDSESSSGVCSNPTGYDCQTTLGYSVKNVDVNKAKCTAQGITCLNSEQDSNRQCPDFKVRFVCPCSSAINMCNSAPCQNGGVCINHMHGYQCKCKQGYTGYRCERVLHCGDPRPFAYGKVFGTTFSPNGVVTFTCDSGFKLIGSSSLKCKEGQWQGQIPRCEDINECQQNKCQQQVCTNTLGGYSCSCGKGFRQANGGTCQDINECATNNGNCQGRCVNTAGSYRCLCGKGMQLTKDGLKCEDINECASNNARGPCDHFCVNSFGGYRCKCRQGFTSSGNNCQATSCPRLSAPASGNKIPNTDITTIDTVVTFSCHATYKLVGSRTRTCLVDGTWSGVQPICSQIRCHSTPVLLNGRRSSSSNHAGAKITYSCNNGYKLVGTSLLRCQDDYQWSDPAPRCIRTDCPEPSAPRNGKVFGSQSTIGSTIRYECSVGHTFVNNAINYAECSSNKQWSNPKPTCQLINCGDPGKVSNGQRSGSTFTYNSVVTYTCNTGYRITGSERRTCQDDGRWSGVQTECLANSCGDPGTPVNGEKSGLDYIYNKVVTFKCKAGYKMIGDASRTCQVNTRWSGLQPKCQLVHCGDPGIPSNGERTGSNMNAGSGLFYECKPGFKLVGAEKLLCQNNGLWSAAVPSCAVSSCGSELHGPSGSFKSPDYPNLYGNNRYCRWKIIVPVNKKVMIRFKSLDTENKKDWVTVSDPKTRTLITALTGINPNEMFFTSSSNEMEVKFTSNNERESIGFEATYEQVSCGGIITNLNSVIQSPGYPNNYPDSTTCVWQVILPGQRISLAFDDFSTEQSYDFVKVYNKVNQFNGDTLLARFSGFVGMQTLSSPTGYMHIIFSSNAKTNSKGFKAKIVKYQKTFGK